VIVLDTGGLYRAGRLDRQSSRSRGQLALIDEVTRGVYQLELFSPEDPGHARRIMERYADLRIGLADASVVVLANRHRTLDLLCTDGRHFRALKGSGGKSFRLLPFDA
jgi:predicted nucleic acid-binding protein